MIFNTFELHQEGSLPGAHLVTYIQEYSEAMAINDRPLILLCPGGGYTRTSDREAEPMALKFLAMGYHAAVLRYSCAPAEYPTSLKELAYSIKFLREHAKEWHIDPHKIVVEGCSAGGHLAASLGCSGMKIFWQRVRDFRHPSMSCCVRTDCCYAIRSSLPESLPTEDLLRIC